MTVYKHLAVLYTLVTLSSLYTQLNAKHFFTNYTQLLDFLRLQNEMLNYRSFSEGEFNGDIHMKLHLLCD